MKLQIETMTALLMLAVILLAGCSGDKDRIPDQVEVPIESPIVTLSEKAKSETVPTTLYPPDNPYEDLTVTGTAPPPDFHTYHAGDLILWIPEFEYKLEYEGPPGEGNKSVPIAPNHAEKWARYEQRKRDDFYKLGKRQEGVKSEKRRSDMSREVDAKLADFRAEIMTEGMTPLNAAKYLTAHKINTEHKKQYAQQALDQDPDDYHTLLVWTYVQQDFDTQRKGWRRLLKMRPNDAYVLSRLGDITFSAEAIPILKKAYQYAPDVPKDHPTFWKKGILYELAQAYYYKYEDAKALETLKYLSKYAPSLSRYSIERLQRENKLGIVGRPKKEKNDE